VHSRVAGENRMRLLVDTVFTIIFNTSQANFGTSFGEKWVQSIRLAFLCLRVMIGRMDVRIGFPKYMGFVTKV
jgi:hypothetical protein